MSVAVAVQAAREIALALNRSHVTGESLHAVTRALLDNASDLADIVEEFAVLIAPIIQQAIEESVRAQTPEQWERVAKAIRLTLDEGNSESTVDWDFYSEFEDIRELEREVVISDVKCRLAHDDLSI